MIVPCIALAVAVGALVFVLYNGREIRRLQRESLANLYLTEIRMSRARYYRRQADQLRRENAAHKPTRRR